MSDNITVSTTLENINIEYSYPTGPQGIKGDPGSSLWGTISGTLSGQTDLWRYLSADSDAQTLSYTPSSIEISISNGNTIALNNLITKPQALAYSIAL